MDASCPVSSPDASKAETALPERAAGGASHWFLPAAILYLATPVLLFCLMWLKPVIGWPVAIFIGVALAAAFENKQGCCNSSPFDRRGLWALALLALLWTFFSGVGAFIPQSYDYQKHNLLMHDLEIKSWPVYYQSDRGLRYLCYSLGYYLPPMAVGSAAGEGVGNCVMFLWTAAAFFLILFWVGSMNARRPWITIGVFLVVGGIQVLWHLARVKLPYLLAAHPLNPNDVLHAFDLMGIANTGYTNPFIKSYWTPQHCIAGWLGFAVLYELLFVRGQIGLGFLVWTLALAWSPLTCLGLAVVPAAWIFCRPTRWRVMPLSLGAGLAVFVLYALYYSAHDPVLEKGAIWTFDTVLSWPLYYLLYVVTQVVLLATCIWFADRRWKLEKEWRILFVFSFAILIVLPLYKFGFSGDLRIHASTAPWVVLAVAAARSLTSSREWNPAKVCLAGLIALAVVTTLERVERDVTGADNVKNLWKVDGDFIVLPDYKAATLIRYGVSDLSKINSATAFSSPFDLAGQYLGRTDSFFSRWLLKAPQAEPVESSTGS